MRSPENMGGSPEKPENEVENEERELHVTISKEATFADLLGAIETLEEEEGFGALHFEDELQDSFNPETVREALDLLDEGSEEAATTGVIDFFIGHGYEEEDIIEYLPIEFE